MTGTPCSCGCGRGGADPATPVEVFNPPGLDAVRYRVGEYGRFVSAMLDRLSDPAYPALRGLTVRTPDDPAIALVDAAAVVGDVLTFYSERIANEGYLRTATEEGSLALLGGLVGHKPRPGVAAETYLAYTVDRDPRSGQETAVVVPRGTRSQSVPGQGEEPQSFETVEDLTARWSWNELQVLQRRPYQLTAARLAKRSSLFAAGTTNNIKQGDQLLFIFSADRAADRSQRILLTVPGVNVDRDSGTTVIGLPQASLPSLQGIKTVLTRWITPGGEHNPNPWPEHSRIVSDFDDQVLAPLRSELDTLDTPPKLADRLTQILARLREAKAYGQDYRDVSDWFEALDTELTRLRAQALALQPPQPATAGTGARTAAASHVSDVASPPGAPGSEPGDSPGEVHDPALAGLGPLLSALRTPAAGLPPDARSLPRDPQRSYAPGSDLGTQLLTALDPRLRDGLYSAWGNADLGAPLALLDAQAMRVTATPFGATAPLKPVYDTTGRVESYADWPLTGSKLTGIRIDYDTDGTTPHGIAFSYTEAGGSVSLNFTLPQDDGPHEFGPGRIELATTGDESALRRAFEAGQEHGVTARLQAHLPERDLFVSRPGDDGRIHVTITATGTTDEGDGNGPNPPLPEPLDFHLAPGDRLTVPQGAYQITVERSTGDGATSVGISLASQLGLTSRNVLALDAVYEGIAPGSWIAVDRPRKGVTSGVPGDPALSRVITRVSGVRVLSRADFGITGKVTELTLEDPWLDEKDTLLSHIRDTSVYARGESFRLADEPLTDDVGGDLIDLAQLHQGLAPGRWIVVSGERTDIPGTPGVHGSEPAMVLQAVQSVDPALPGNTVRTTLMLTAPLAYRYKRSTVKIYGNVVRATQGATRDEPIGSGDASQAGQSFVLWQAPLTWLAADTPEGAASTLRIRVDGVLWHEVDTLAAAGPHDRVYTTSTTEDGRIRVTFGDGVHGSRLPGGHENVRATYRTGIGRSANLAAEKITQLATRPLGVTGVTNPLPASGGADPEGTAGSTDTRTLTRGFTPRRRQIPLAVSALDRLVSVPDYADFTRARAGIGRATAAQLFDGRRQLVHVTVAGVDDIPIAADSGLLTALRASLAEYGDLRLPVQVAVREKVLLLLAAQVTVGQDHDWEQVEPALRSALLARFGFDARELAQPAYLSEVLATAHFVPGVDHIEVTAFTGVPGDLTPQGLERLGDRLTVPQDVVAAQPARHRIERHRVTDPAGETLTDIAAQYGISLVELLRLNPDLTGTQPLLPPRSVVVFRGIRPAQLAVLSPDLPDTLILKEASA
ncbi:putative baseplate assembly protein [Streptomyces sp. CoH27]|uniref:putative baseplate assembly protein n=1 Tax=Streptomyces sp. CoH27 TaxID=2875763 RepID=UPI001CD790F6|nr:putative baseplate assembly protein [Streptomyces sp. CoH27]